MKKRQDAQIFIMAHKEVDYPIWDNSLYTPVQIGKNKTFLKHRDSDCEDNIADWNLLRMHWYVRGVEKLRRRLHRTMPIPQKT